MTKGVTESQFYMWRTLFAIAHADNVITEEERKFMEEALRDIPFSAEQKQVLRDDIKIAQDIGEMFRGILDKSDQARFFKFAQKLVWTDGEYSPEEQEIMLQLQSEHIRGTNVDELIGSVDLELEDENWKGGKPRSAQSLVHSFRESFLKTRFGAAAQ